MKFCREIRFPLPDRTEGIPKLSDILRALRMSVSCFGTHRAQNLRLWQFETDYYSEFEEIRQKYQKSLNDVFTHALVDFLNEFIGHNWMSSLFSLLMHICASIPEFPAPIPRKSVTHNIITVHTIMYFCGLGSMNHTTDITTSWNDDYRVHVNSIATYAHLNKMDCKLAFSETTLYLFLQEM